MTKKTTAWRPDVTIEYQDGKLIQIIDMASLVSKASMRRFERNNRAINNWPIGSAREDQDTMLRSSQ